MKKVILAWIGGVLIFSSFVFGAPKELEIQGKRLVSQKPSFTMKLPSEFLLIHSFKVENPAESSRTRIAFFIKEKNKQVEELLIVQIAEKTDPQAGPMTAPSLKPYTEKRMYSKGVLKRKEVELDYLIQLMAWNPEASSLQPIVKKGITIPSHWALQGQMLFLHEGEHAVLVRYSKSVNSFGIKVSDKGDDWNKGTISGNERMVSELFQKAFMEMLDSMILKGP